MVTRFLIQWFQVFLTAVAHGMDIYIHEIGALPFCCRTGIQYEQKEIAAILLYNKKLQFIVDKFTF